MGVGKNHAGRVSGECVSPKNWAGLWLAIAITLMGLLWYIPYVQGTPTELAGTTLDFETGDLRGWIKDGGSIIGIDPKFVNVRVRD